MSANPAKLCSVATRLPAVLLLASVVLMGGLAGCASTPERDDVTERTSDRRMYFRLNFEDEAHNLTFNEGETRVFERPDATYTVTAGLSNERLGDMEFRVVREDPEGNRSIATVRIPPGDAVDLKRDFGPPWPSVLIRAVRMVPPVTQGYRTRGIT
ncbi:MAG TPA: hypothetical protein VHQ65_09865 [Thermoanaerobaculia bacterium]|nr:hypothetical protein [Thermoanaerobaculia bacterium]